MKITLTTHQAARELVNDANANWSYKGALALVEYLDEIDEDAELDVVAIRCDYSEHASFQEWADGYFGEMKRIDMTDKKIREYIQDNGTLIEFEGGIIVSSF